MPPPHRPLALEGALRRKDPLPCWVGCLLPPTTTSTCQGRTQLAAQAQGWGGGAAAEKHVCMYVHLSSMLQSFVSRIASFGGTGPSGVSVWKSCC